jgi:hypothetical protein
MKPPSGAGALLRKNGLQEKRATKATLSSLLLSSRRAVDDDGALGLRRHEIVRLDALALIGGERERPVYPEAKVIAISELRERRAKAIADLDLGSYQLQEGDVVLDHERGTAYRFSGGRPVLQ